MGSEFSYIIEAPEKRLDAYLARTLALSRVLIQEQIKAGQILVNGKPALKTSLALKTGDVVTGGIEEAPTDFVGAVEHPLDVLYEDEELMAINKPQSMVVHPASAHKGETLVHYLLHYLKNSPSFVETSTVRPGIVHRLDKGTSGVLLIAKNRQMVEALSNLFQKREIAKEYEAIVWGQWKGRGTIRSDIGRDIKDRKKISSKTTKGRASVTNWETVSVFSHFSHMALRPQTGRTHQLRVHLTEANHPIVGDPVYGRGTTSKRKASLAPALVPLLEALEHPFLHARALKFIHPKSGKPIQLEAPRPAPFEAFLSALSVHDSP